MEARTSATHPLRIDCVKHGAFASIGLTICPGKKDSGALTGVWSRDLGADLDVIAEAGFALVLTLLEDEEFDRLQVPRSELESGLTARGIECHHLPIRDVSTPDQRFELPWLYSGARARHFLRTGRPVLVHCKGGLGRSGLVAARLLVELGVAVDVAVREVRAARPGAIETPAQFEHVQSCGRRIAIGFDVEREERAIGVLVAGAVGDALGAAVEFDDLERIRARFGPAGIQAYSRCYGGLGRITDDTQMTLFTAEALLEALVVADEPQVKSVISALDGAYRRWRMTQEAGPSSARGKSGLLGRPEIWSARAPGGTCLSALQERSLGRPDRPINDSKGCGGLMRVAPIGIVGDRFASPTLTFDLALRSAALTHGHPSGQFPAAIFAVMIQELMAGRSLDEAEATALELLPDRPSTEETRSFIDASRAFDGPDTLIPEVIEQLGAGFVAEEALGIAIACARAATDIEQALFAAVNHGGDSDSTGLLAAQLMAASRGVGVLAPRWLEALEMRDLLLEYGRDLARASRWQPGPARIDRLLEHLSFFESPPAELVAEVGAELVSYRDELAEFEQLLYRDGWLPRRDPDHRLSESSALTREPRLLAAADAETLRGLFITHFRPTGEVGSRLESAIRSGGIAAILRRLRSLR